jgi:hypothetical protein
VRSHPIQTQQHVGVDDHDRLPQEHGLLVVFQTVMRREHVTRETTLPGTTRRRRQIPTAATFTLPYAYGARPPCRAGEHHQNGFMPEQPPAEKPPATSPPTGHPQTNNSEPHPTFETADLLEVTRACLHVWETLPFPMSVPAPIQDVFRVGFPLAAHALNNAHVALDTWNRFPWVAAANARIAFEHAFIAQWVQLTEDGPHQFVRHASHQDLVAAKEFADAIAGQTDLTSATDPELLANLTTYTSRDYRPGHERQWGIQAMVRRFDQTGLLYGTYRALSNAVHPSTRTISAHLDVTAQNAPQLRRAGNLHPDHNETARALALAALWALNFIEKCDTAYRPPGRAGEIATPHLLPYDLAHSDQPPQTH